MKIKFLSTGNSPDYYSFDGEIITAISGGQHEDFDLSVLEAGDKFEGVESVGLINKDGYDIPGSQIIRNAYRDSAGELHVVLCQAVGPGHWGETEEMDVSNYDPNTIQVPFKGHGAGRPWALTKQGQMEVPNG